MTEDPAKPFNMTFRKAVSFSWLLLAGQWMRDNVSLGAAIIGQETTFDKIGVGITLLLYMAAFVVGPALILWGDDND